MTASRIAPKSMREPIFSLAVAIPDGHFRSRQLRRPLCHRGPCANSTRRADCRHAIGIAPYDERR